MRYRDAGVDLESSDALKARLGEEARATWTPGVRPLPGGFCGIVGMPGAPPEARLVAATMDGVGTKLHLALELGGERAAAADLVYHGADDLLVHGARPLAFLDYVAQGQLVPERVAAIVAGLAEACRAVGAALLGGETAEMPDTYLPGVVDVAGCMIGTVDPARIVDGSAVRPGDTLLGLASQGLHTNGFSLARRILKQSGATLDLPLEGGTLGGLLLAPHRWYGPSLEPLLGRGEIRALAHVTGGGIAGNLVRVLPEGMRAEIDPAAWTIPPVFRWLMDEGSVPVVEARRVWNLGIGMVAACAPERAPAVARALRASGETVYPIGVLASGVRGVRWKDGGAP